MVVSEDFVGQHVHGADFVAVGGVAPVDDQPDVGEDAEHEGGGAVAAVEGEQERIHLYDAARGDHGVEAHGKGVTAFGPVALDDGVGAGQRLWAGLGEGLEAERVAPGVSELVACGGTDARVVVGEVGEEEIVVGLEQLHAPLAAEGVEALGEDCLVVS